MCVFVWNLFSKQIVDCVISAERQCWNVDGKKEGEREKDRDRERVSGGESLEKIIFSH